jgi:hypothetical protein
MATRTLSIRLPQDDAVRLEAVALADGVTVAEEVRQAVRILIDQRRRDQNFKLRAAAALDQQRRILDELMS